MARKRRTLVEGVRVAVEGATASRDAVVRWGESGVEALGKTYAWPAGKVPRFEVWGRR